MLQATKAIQPEVDTDLEGQATGYRLYSQRTEVRILTWRGGDRLQATKAIQPEVRILTWRRGDGDLVAVHDLLDAGHHRPQGRGQTDDGGPLAVEDHLQRALRVVPPHAAVLTLAGHRHLAPLLRQGGPATGSFMKENDCVCEISSHAAQTFSFGA